ncbi:MAG: DUF4390 domain-containing protein [bacterium]
MIKDSHLRFCREKTIKSVTLIFSLLIVIICSNAIFCVKASEGAKAIIKEIQAIKDNRTIIVNATLEGAFSPDITEAISSGAPTRFRFLIHLMKRQGFWLDEKVKELTLHNTVVYDVLKKEYIITRSFPGNLEESYTTEDWDEMTKWMSELKSVQFNVPELKDKKDKYYLKIRAEMKCIKIPFPLNYLLAFVALWNFDTPWVKVPLDANPKKSEMIEQALIPHGKEL